jgi:broad specificity phosphatase PhoE
MSTTHLYLVRHGESEGNANDLHQFAHVGLSARGREEARALAARLVEVPIDTIVSSTLTRAMQTAAIVGDVLDKPVVPSPLFVEIKRPSVIEGRSSTEPEVVSIKNRILDHWHEPEWRHSDEETFFDLRARAIDALEYIAGQQADSLLVITHGQFMRLMVCVMAFGRNVDPHTVKSLQSFLTMSNCGVTRSEYRGGRWLLRTWNGNSA